MAVVAEAVMWAVLSNFSSAQAKSFKLSLAILKDIERRLFEFYSYDDINIHSKDYHPKLKVLI